MSVRFYYFYDCGLPSLHKNTNNNNINNTELTYSVKKVKGILLKSCLTNVCKLYQKIHAMESFLTTNLEVFRACVDGCLRMQFINRNLCITPVKEVMEVSAVPPLFQDRVKMGKDNFYK